MKILITGGSSYFGQHLVPFALSDFEVSYTYHSHDPLALLIGEPVDVRDETAVSRLIAAHKPDTIIHLAGSNRGADMANVIIAGTRHITHVAEQNNIRLIHMSTDCVFDGLNPPYDETAVPTPVNAYGQAKTKAEAIVQRHPNHVILRTSLIYSLEHMDHGTSWMTAALQRGESVTLFDNQMRNPIWTTTLAQACLELVTNSYNGILHVAGSQTMTRADFSLKMLDWWGITERHTLTIGPSTSGSWPLDLSFNVSKGTAVLNTALLGVDQVLQLRHGN